MNSPCMRIAAAQISATDDPEQNLHAVTAYTQRAAEGGTQIVVFPEATMACFGTDLGAVAQGLDGPFAQGVRASAQRHGITVVVGMFTPAEDGRVHNTLLVTGPDGECSYDKIHLYDAFGSRESDTVAPGDQIVTTLIGGAHVGVATCYDLRFADQFTALGRAGAELVLVPASWGEGPGKAEQWDVLTRARAMDAQAYLLACDMAWTAPQGAQPLGIGRSVLIDPLGRVRARLGHEEGLLLAEADLSTVADIRRRVPVL
ncbi:carbon-nitrogen hydrolase family protein [Gephyromycinifex aptenodytis]|uniref:carbon-nitrogen hydrolase family protein n=1 Tax=Gephyromycinifex aptenodytis TaxID=2716227 RepID=UPI001444F4D4|nr:carbon-nitrogen hydrolase family protein [Gephyromycinifex aptenodytis]